jgi:DNA-binding GntR family transcriptional regulator
MPFATISYLAKIREAEKAYEKAIAASIKSGDSLIMIEKNSEFHMAIARAGRNAYFADLYRRLLDEGRRMLHLHFQYEALDPDLSVEKMASDHTDIVNAIEKGDADTAEEWAHAHAMQFKGQFMQFLDRNLTAGIPLDFKPRPAPRAKSSAKSHSLRTTD